MGHIAQYTMNFSEMSFKLAHRNNRPVILALRELLKSAIQRDARFCVVVSRHNERVNPNELLLNYTEGDFTIPDSLSNAVGVKEVFQTINSTWNEVGFKITGSIIRKYSASEEGLIQIVSDRKLPENPDPVLRGNRYDMYFIFGNGLVEGVSGAKSRSELPYSEVRRLTGQLERMRAKVNQIKPKPGEY